MPISEEYYKLYKAELRQKSGCWLHIMYPENMIDGWKDEISDVLGKECCYCVHDKDTSGHKGDRKIHVHLINPYPKGGQTMKAAWELVEQLAKPGCTCSLKPQRCGDIAHSYDYLIHDTESARKLGKYLYPESERICVNGFDIDRYIVLDSEERLKMAHELFDFAEKGNFFHMKAFKKSYDDHYGEDMHYFEVMRANRAHLESICRGNYLQWRLMKEKRQEELDNVKCLVCHDQDNLSGTLTIDGQAYYYCEKHVDAAKLFGKTMEDDHEVKYTFAKELDK